MLEPINLPSWPDAYVYRMPDHIRGAFAECLARLRSRRTKRELRAKLIAQCVCDETIERVFKNEQWTVIARLPEAELVHVFKIACRLNGLPQE